MTRICFYTFGCKTNQYETQLLREQLSKSGLEEVSALIKADIYIINSCTVTHDADAACRKLVRRILRSNPLARIIVTGCYAIRAPREIRSACNEKTQIEVFPEKEKISQFFGCSTINYQLSTINWFHNHARAFVKIQDGCDAFCSYCIVPYVRPELWSRPAEEIIKEINILVANGYKEIVLTGIRLGKYKFKDKYRKVYNLRDLISELEKIKGLFRLRLSSLEMNEIDNKLIRLIAKSKKICHHLHIPLQSGDNYILKLMNRPYNTEEFKMKIEQIRQYIPDIGISTDIIVGFPGEEEKHFLSSYQFVKESNFSRIHVFPYSARPGTVAVGFDSQVPIKIKEIRIKKFLALNEYLQNEFRKKFIGQRMQVLLDKREKDGKFSGFTSNYIRIYTEQGKKNEMLQLTMN